MLYSPSSRLMVADFAPKVNLLGLSLTRPQLGVFVLIVLGVAFRVTAGQLVGLGYGESYHYSCAIRPNLSYFDHPPMAVWLSGLSMWILQSNGPTAIRMPFILMFMGTTWMTFLLGRKLFSEWAGFYAALLLNLSAVYTLSVAIFLQPDGPLMFFWLACVCCLVKIFFTDNLQRPYLWWSLVGITLGLTALSKYHAVFLLFGAGMFAITRKDQRHWIWHPGPYLAMVIGAAMFAPVVVWNSQHGWISFLWQGSRGLDNHGLRLDWLARSIGGQALWLLPWIWAPLVWELPKCLRAGPSSKERWFIGWMAVAPIVLFTVVAAYASLGFHFHWQAPGYLLLFLPLGDTVHRKLSAGDKRTRIWMRGSIGFTCVALLFLTTHSATGWWRSVGPQWLSAKFGEADDPTLECLDYWTLPNALAERGLADRKDLFLITNRWFQSGKVDYAMKGTMPVFCFNWLDPRGFAFWDQSENWIGKDAVVVSTKKFLNDPVQEYHQYFENIEPIGTVDVTRNGHVEEVLYLHLCHNLKEKFPKPY